MTTLNKKNDSLQVSRYRSDLIFFKKLKKYEIVKNQILYFQQKHSSLSSGKKEELKKQLIKSLNVFNGFLLKNELGNIEKEIKKVDNFEDLSTNIKFLIEELDPKIENFKQKYIKTVKDYGFMSEYRKNRDLRKIAKNNYSGKYKNSYNRKKNIQEAANGYAFMAPAIILIGVFMIFSIGFGIYMSFNKVKVTGGGLTYKFVGLDQYKYIFQSDTFRHSLKITLIYMAMVAPIQTVLALILSSVLATKIKGKKVFTVLYFLPTLTSSTALTLIFLRLFGNGGPIGSMLGGDFVNKHILGLVAIMNIWTSIPYFLTIYNAANADVPKSQYEAASIDGASGIKKFFQITVPYLRPIIAFVLLTSIIWTLQTFDQLFIIGKDPTLSIKSEDITSTAKWIYDMAFGSFQHQDFGRAAAGSIVLAAIIFVFSIISNMLSKGGKK